MNCKIEAIKVFMMVISVRNTPKKQGLKTYEQNFSFVDMCGILVGTMIVFVETIGCFL